MGKTTMPVDGVSFSVVGAGRSGIAAANALAMRGGDVVLLEERSPVPRPDRLRPDVEFRDGSNQVREGDVVVLSPGVPEVSPLRAEVAKRGKEVIGEVELFYRLSPTDKIIAITGTDGKSTTTTMISGILEAAGADVFVGGNLGNPLCEALEGLGRDGEAITLTPETVVVAEVSCFQLTTCVDFRPLVAVVTNIAEDHVNYHGSFRAYQAAKRRIWLKMTAADTLVLNADDAYIGSWDWPEKAEDPTIHTFSLAGYAETHATYTSKGPSKQLLLHGEPLMERSELQLLGHHNVENALGAALAARAFGVELPAIRAGLAAYKPLPHRLATVGVVDDVHWVNDSKATNPNAATAGVNAIETPLVLIAGGSVKDTDFTAFGQLIRQRSKAAVLFGQTRETLVKAIGSGHPIAVVETLEQAVSAARHLADPGDTVLLSPACASFDQFDSYAHRGRTFIELVEALGAA